MWKQASKIYSACLEKELEKLLFFKVHCVTMWSYCRKRIMYWRCWASQNMHLAGIMFHVLKDTLVTKLKSIVREGKVWTYLNSGETQVINNVCNSLHIVFIQKIKYSKKDRNCWLNCKWVGELKGLLHYKKVSQFAIIFCPSYSSLPVYIVTMCNVKPSVVKSLNCYFY